MTRNQIDNPPSRRRTERTGNRDVSGAVNDLSHAAAAIIDEFGPNAVEIALARADIALEAGNGEAFQTWLDVASAIQDTTSFRTANPSPPCDQNVAKPVQKNA